MAVFNLCKLWAPCSQIVCRYGAEKVLQKRRDKTSRLPLEIKQKETEAITIHEENE